MNSENFFVVSDVITDELAVTVCGDIEKMQEPEEGKRFETISF